MFCSRCGTWAPDDLATCPLCGLALQTDNWTKVQQPARQVAPGVAGVALVTYGGFWRRFTALLIDYMVMFFPVATVRVLLGLSAFGAADEFTPVVWIATCLQMLMGWLYAASLIASSGRGTLGQQVMDLHVTDLHGDRVSFARASGRYWATLLTLLTLGLGVLMQLWNTRRQTLHDWVAGTVVVRPRPEPAPGQAPVMRLVQ